MLEKRNFYLLIAVIFLLSVFSALEINRIHETINKSRNNIVVDKIYYVDAYKDKYEELLEKTEMLMERNRELEVHAEKWRLLASRYGSVDRGDDVRSSSNHEGMEKKRMRVTAYTEYECGKEPDHPEFGITASGNRVEKWFTVAAGPELPFGTVVYIPYFKDCENNGIFVVEDRGGAIRRNCIDVYIPDQKMADEFGCKWLDVYVVKTTPPVSE